MEKVDFNEYADNYNNLMQQQHKKFGNVEYYSEYKITILKQYYRNELSKDLNILEFGCGIGNNLKYLQTAFKNSKVYGFDISDESLEHAKKNNPNIEMVNEEGLQKLEEKIDLIFIAGVYHHIAPNLRDAATKNIYNLLKKKKWKGDNF